MKKVILLAAIALGTMGASAQTTVAGSKFTDNWSFTLKGGAVLSSKMVKDNGFWDDARGVVGVELRKQITPVFGLGAEGEWSVNTSSWTGVRSGNVFDHQYVGVFGAVNFMNAFAGYTGAPVFSNWSWLPEQVGCTLIIPTQHAKTVTLGQPRWG